MQGTVRDEAPDVVFVTASAGAGIGSATARLFAERGMSVVVSDVHSGRTAETAARIAADTGAAVHAYPLDVTSADEVRRTFAAVAEEVGEVTILVNNSGITALAPVELVTAEQWNRVLNVSLTGPMLCMQQVIPAMKNRRSGSIVNVSSVAGWRPLADGESAYAAAKAGLMGLTKAAAVELGAFNVRVNAVAPGLIYNPFLKKHYSQDWMDAWIAATPLSRAGRPEEIARAIFEVATSMTFMTGEVVNVSGGVYLSS